MKARAIVLGCCIITALICGCEMTPARYKVLSFFFDGVPKPEEAAPAGAIKDAKGAPLTQIKPRGSQHGPYAAKECTACHQRATNRLLAPIEDLCLRCHVIPTDKKYLHGPLASGGCRVCHDPHSSGYPFLLVSPSKDFCYHCHDRTDVMKRDVHKSAGAECTACHDAHSSDIQYLLK